MSGKRSLGIGGEALEVSVRLVADRTRIGTTTDRASAGRLGVRVMGTLRSSSRLLELADLYSSGHLQIPIWKSFPLTSGPAAHREVETGHVRGKVVLEV
ncbi:MAG: zinc-binding dehydrogenase [Chloroflexi bacterium]|nr:zinc-binding dehydrogenase [Chloroflexota bacterium]